MTRNWNTAGFLTLLGLLVVTSQLMAQGRYWEPIFDPEGNYISQNFGVNVGKVPKGKTYVVNGHPATKEEAEAAVESPPEDANLLHVVVTGNEAFLARVARDWSTLGSSSQRAVLHCYPTNHWWWTQQKVDLNASSRLRASGQMIMVVQPTGVVPHVQSDYKGPEDLRWILTNFTPDTVPDKRSGVDLNKYLAMAMDWVKANPLMAIIIAGILWFLWNKKDTPK